MKNNTNKRLVAIILLAVMCLPLISVTVTAAPTGYTKASDVVYTTYNGYTVNWGSRGEVATFLSSRAEAFYAQSATYSYETISEISGGASQADAHKSELYRALQDLMKAEHTKETNYQETRPMYCFTDCENGDTSKISSFYSGTYVSGVWDSGKTWNREHTWPNSKGMNGNDENDIMMLRPTSVKENSSRGNKSYGLSSGYFDPSKDARGDCARIVLYVYVRWGNVDKMWGSSGVIENLDVLLSWMQEDPVDTWEMGRNDAVESITGTRNVFVDYPEYAYLLFSRELPDYVTPSGMAKEAASCDHVNTELRAAAEASCAQNGYTGDTVCLDCGVTVTAGQVIEKTGEHTLGDWVIVEEAAPGVIGVKEKQCTVCGYVGATEGFTYKVETTASQDTGSTETKEPDTSDSVSESSGNCASVSIPLTLILLSVTALPFIFKKKH